MSESTVQVSTTLTLCRFNADPQSPALTNTYSILFYAGVSVSTEHTLTPTRRLLNFGQALPALASIHSTPSSASCWARVTTMRRVGLHTIHDITRHVHQKEVILVKLHVSSAA